MNKLLKSVTDIFVQKDPTAAIVDFETANAERKVYTKNLIRTLTDLPDGHFSPPSQQHLNGKKSGKAVGNPYADISSDRPHNIPAPSPTPGFSGYVNGKMNGHERSEVHDYANGMMHYAKPPEDEPEYQPAPKRRSRPAKRTRH